MKLTTTAAAVAALAFAAPATATTPGIPDPPAGDPPCVNANVPLEQLGSIPTPPPGICLTIDVIPAVLLPDTRVGQYVSDVVVTPLDGESRIYVPPTPTDLRGGGGALTDLSMVQ